MSAPQAGQPSLYDCVANDDYDEMIRIYAIAARDAIVSYSTVRRRWASARASSFCDEPRAEEKLDDYCQQHLHYAEETTRGSSYISHETFHPCQVRHSVDARSFGPDELAPPLQMGGESSSVEAMINGVDSLLNESVASDTDSKVVRDRLMAGDVVGGQPPKKTRKQAPTQDSSAHTVPVPHLKREGCELPTVNLEAERVAADAVTSLSNARPSSSFVLFCRNPRRREGATHQSTSANASKDAPRNEHDGGGPPIFDGSVANATPPAGGAAGSGTSGGSGTILHLACAVDSPFALSLLLAMGADASARHTAFRRLMVHEAACSGSDECLELLLELGRRSALSLKSASAKSEKHSSSRGMFDATSLVPGPLSRGTATFGRDSEMTIQSTWSTRKRGQGVEDEGTVEKRGQGKDGGGVVDGARSVRSWPFLSTLRNAWYLVNQIKSGNMSELDAGRSLLAGIDLTEPTRKALAKSCCFTLVTSGATQPGLVYDQSTAAFSSGFADGHGNTPLHWASFKNASPCVSVLLSYGANPNARANPSGWTPLHDAAYSDAAQAVQLLLEADADVNARANSGATPLCFAAQEDSPRAAKLLLEHGADPAVRCCGHSAGQGMNATSAAGNNANSVAAPNTTQQFHHSRFSGYTPLHYCAHYNAHRAARVLLAHPSSFVALEVPDLNERLPIHVAVARGSSDVLRELLSGGARVDTSGVAMSTSPRASSSFGSAPTILPHSDPLSIVSAVRRVVSEHTTPQIPASPPPAAVITPVSSPVLRSMIPSRPITSSKPWNCLSQRSINECRQLLSAAEMNWSPDRHLLFTPSDRRAVLELLRVGKRLEQIGTGIFLDLWPLVLSFCGRGWFDIPMIVRQMGETWTDSGVPFASSGEQYRTEASLGGSEESDEELTQFRLDG